MAPQNPTHQICKDLKEPLAVCAGTGRPAAGLRLQANPRHPEPDHRPVRHRARVPVQPRGGPEPRFGGIILEISLILDSVDGELARAKGMASEWGRIVDGIGDDVSGMAILVELMIGVPESRGDLMVLTALIFLRGITFDYFKEYMMGRVTYGYDGPGPDLIFFSSPCFPVLPFWNIRSAGTPGSCLRRSW